MSDSEKTDPPRPQVPPEQAAAEQAAADEANARRRSRYLLLGFPVVFKVASEHLTKTLRSGRLLDGSVFHAELTEFAGTIGRVNDDGTADIALIIPGSADLRWVANVSEGDEPGSFRPISG